MYGSKIHGWEHIRVLEDDGEFVKFQLCCVMGEYRDTVYYARSSDIQQRSMGSLSESNDFDWAKETPVPPIHVGGKLQTPNGNILTITKIGNKRQSTGIVQMVHWKVFFDGAWVEPSGRYWDVEKLIEDGVWIPVT